MFPLKNTEAYIHANGYRSTLGKELAARDAEISELGSEIQALTNQLTDEAKTRAALGAHNLMPMTINGIKAANTAGTWSGNSYTRGGVTFTIETNSAGIITGIDINSSSVTSDTPLKLCNNGELAGLVNKPVTVSINHPANNIRFMVYQYDGTGELTDSTGEVTGTITNSNCFAQIYIPSAAVGQAFDHVKVYPMIRLATDADPTYQPYAKTNLELTDALTPTTGTFTYAGKTFYYASYEDKIVIRCDTTLPTADLPAASWTTLASAESVPNKLGHNAFGVLHRDDGTIMGIYVSTTGLVQAKIITAGTNASSNLQDTAILC